MAAFAGKAPASVRSAGVVHSVTVPLTTCAASQQRYGFVYSVVTMGLSLHIRFGDCALPGSAHPWPAFSAGIFRFHVSPSCFAQALRKFHVMSFGSYTGIGGSDVQGYLAVAGDTTISHYSVSDQMQPPALSERYIDAAGHNRTTRDDLVVCGDLTFISGAVMGGGNLVYTDTSPDIREPAASLYAPGVFLQVASCPVDFDDARIRLQSLSMGLASYVRTGTSVVEYTYACWR